MMNKKLDVKGIIFDYGGTLDTRGDHWSEVLWKGYEHFGIGVNADEEVEPGVSIGKSSFRDAYVYGERVLAVHPLVNAEDHFEDILRLKIHFQLSFLAGAGASEAGGLSDGSCVQFLWQYQSGVEGCGHRRLFQSRHRVGGSGCSQAKSSYLRPGCLCFGFTGFAGAGGGRYLQQGYSSSPSVGLPYIVDQGIAMGKEGI